MRVSLTLLVIAVACGGCELILGLEGDPVVGTQPDAGVTPACPNVADVADFGDLGFIDGEIIQDEGYLGISSILDEGPPQDLFAIELHAGLEPFVDGITTGSFEITGRQTSLFTCGVCAEVVGDLGDTAPSMVFLAQSGTITVTSIEGNFAGSYAPAGDTARYVGYSFDEATGEVTRQEGCVLNGGGARWNKAIPAP